MSGDGLVDSAVSKIQSPASKRSGISEMAEVRELSLSELEELKLIHSGVRNNGVLNAFRELRTKLLHSSKGENFICLVTSLCDGGGSSYVSMNLAAAVALDKTKTSLLVDCNLYDPSVDRLLGVEADYGLTDFLDEPELQVQDIIYASGVPRMRLIPVGSNRERGAEHFSSGRMTQFVDGIKSRYSDRYVFIDAPPIVSSAEAKILASLCDMVVLVVPYGKVSGQQLDAGIAMVAEDKLAGVVFNN